MQELILIKKHWKLLLISSSSFFLLFIVLLCCSSTGGSEEGLASTYFTTPFSDDVKYTITSNFGMRTDPFDENNKVFHSGIDLSAPEDTEIVASADGEIYEVGYSEDGLGNYVYIKHDLDGVVYYTIYGHMLDDSIVVSKDDKIKAKEKLGVIGSTGKSTGTHLHFMICKSKISFKEKDLIDPKIIGL